MRKGLWLGGLALILVLYGGRPVRAQYTLPGTLNLPSQFQTAGTSPSQFAVGGTATRPTSFSLTSLFHPMGNANSKPVFGQSNFPTLNQMPDKNYFAPFGMMLPKRISP